MVHERLQHIIQPLLDIMQTRMTYKIIQYRTDWRNVKRCNIIPILSHNKCHHPNRPIRYITIHLLHAQCIQFKCTVLQLRDTSSSKQWPLSPSVMVYLQTFFWWRFWRPVSWQTDSGVKMQSPCSTSTSITSSVSRKDRMCTVYTSLWSVYAPKHAPRL